MIDHCVLVLGTSENTRAHRLRERLERGFKKPLLSKPKTPQTTNKTPKKTK